MSHSSDTISAFMCTVELGRYGDRMGFRCRFSEDPAQRAWSVADAILESVQADWTWEKGWRGSSVMFTHRSRGVLNVHGGDGPWVVWGCLATGFQRSESAVIAGKMLSMFPETLSSLVRE